MTTVQTWPSLSIGIANPDFLAAQREFSADHDHFSPALAMRCWINPLSEQDVKLVQGVPLPRDPEEDQSEAATSP